MYVEIDFVGHQTVNGCSSCSDSLVEMPIRIENLISEESLYLSLYPCKILRLRNVAFKRCTQKCSELLESVVTTISELSLHFRL